MGLSLQKGLRRALASALGAAAARATLAGAVTAQGLERTNFRGRPVTLAGGPALAVGASVGAVVGADDVRTATAAAVAGLGSGAVGLYDDLVGGRPEHAAKGFRGHLTALREGRVTSGLVKIAGVGAAALVAAALLPRKRAVDVLLGAGVIAGAANLANLLDLRPGRAIKAGMLVGTPMARSGVASGALGAAGALLPADLNEEIMLGDAGANALGALLGTAFVARTGTAGRLAALAGLVALTAASEKVSFTQVIQRTPGLRELDELGRLKA
jgi:UDP-N-acetylmuramyl pentapeptide phosphotransferase/UDP-N-acetylglucosamine-1-phosphate transferase